ncbi:ATP-dependent DNA helicase [Obba rivulosa]|uniref:ATP-dependent DNA helicase n=1 Tax=Obba rivulosa TaxID=1052685 RepID=A0A8E2DU79_9APHY|nr:ATP-dependent DNA helicase [Obba rivulosa]
MEKARQILKDVFGFDSFRLLQEEAITRLLVHNENALVLFPTGGGKSLTYQVPALCLDGLTLVISPLIALMKDQVDALVRRGVKAANLDSTLTADRAAWVKSEVLSGALKILYVAPERLNNESFIALMKRVKISLLAIDEAHCISQWGASFRPEYLKIARFAEEMDVERVLCLTATATESVAKDICTSFYIDQKDGVFKTPVYRPNLSFKVEVASNLDEKLDRIIPMLKARTGPVIIYCTLQKDAMEVANHLDPHNLDPMVYHAGLPSEERERIQVAFMESEKGIVCATIAFGMGIDKADIRSVIHLHMPKTFENYSQEVGRAGRDGKPSTCLMFLSAADIPVLEGFARGDTCSKRDIELWIQEVALKEPATDGTIYFNHYEQSKTYDIRANVLNLCYAQLELDYNYIRAITPFFSFYDISASSKGMQAILTDNSEAAQIIRRYWRPKGGGYQIDVVNAAEWGKVDRVELARTISGWEMDGHITSKATQIRARYLVINPMPKTTDSIKELADKIYQRMLAREEEAVQKLRQVIDFATGDDCLAHALATYFGNPDAVPEGMCGQCQFCATGSGVDFNTEVSAVADSGRIQHILQACPERDDPRLLARMAFGITSPRLTAGKWSTSHPLFGSMVDVDFNALVAAFDTECAKAGYMRSTTSVVATAPRTAQKRSYTQSRSSDTPRGSYSKRARGRR